MQPVEVLNVRIKHKNVKLAVIGLGYVGLPLAVEFAAAGVQTIGIDVDKGKVDSVNQGVSYIQDVAADQVGQLVSAGLLAATTDFDVLRSVDCVSVCVPTPLRKTKDPDLSFVLAAADEISARLHPGMLIVLESTTYPGTTDEIFLPRLQANGYQVGKDICLAFSPERVDPGNEQWMTRNTPKVIGGVTPGCTRTACALYQHAIERLVPVSSAIAAEMVKLLENTFRMVNIGLVNEMSLMCDRLGVDVWEVIEAAATKPFGFLKFTPGPGLGGHCIPIDPLYLSWKLRSLNYTARFIELATDINSHMPAVVVAKVQDALNTVGKALSTSTVLVLGAAYKPDVADTRESPALDVIGLLQAKKATVQYHDPYIPMLQQDGWSLAGEKDYLQAAAGADCVVIVTNHCCYDYCALLDATKLVVDTRNALGHLDTDSTKVFKL